MQYQNNENTIVRKKKDTFLLNVFTSDVQGNVLVPIFCLCNLVSFLDL